MQKLLGGVFLGLSIALQGVTLLNDQWVQESYERSVRETCRIRAAELIQFVDSLLQFQTGLAIFLTFAGFTIMNHYKITTTYSTLVITIYGLINYSPILYESENIGGERVLLGSLYFLLVLLGIQTLSFDQEVKQK